MSSRVVSAAVLLLVACSTPSGVEAGFETGPCVEGLCFDGLECLSDLCVEPSSADDDDRGPGGGGFVGTGLSDGATGHSGPAETAGSDPSDPSDPSAPSGPSSFTTNDATSDHVTDSSDELPQDDDSTTGSTGLGACGNGQVDPGEQCDGDDVQGFTCAILGLGTGPLQCDPIVCSFDTSMCVPTTSGTTG